MENLKIIDPYSLRGLKTELSKEISFLRKMKRELVKFSYNNVCLSYPANKTLYRGWPHPLYQN